MKKTFVMAVAILFSIVTMAQNDTRKTPKTKKQSGSMQTMGKDTLNMSSDSDSSTNGKYHSNKKSKMNKMNKMKSKNRTPVDSATTL